MSLWHELVRRVAVGAVGLPIVGALLWLGGAWSAALFAAGGAIAAYEYYRMTVLRDAPVRWIGVVALAVLPALPWAVGDRWPEAAVGVVAASSIAAWTALLVRGPRSDAPARAGLLVGGLVYIATGVVALAALRARPDGLSWSACVLIAAWGNDTGAFLGGKLVGRHHMIPAVSPGKTWEGLACGAIAGLAASLGAQRWFTGLTLRDALAIGAIAAVAGPIGDLCKSMVKRAAGVKDSGKIFLSHGGMLDRIDAILFDAPAVLAYLAATIALRH
ncbi:MAG TPA: phosphatidate cytidylyltransferase [Kofleriaceae bacterium]|nr:phosphatidate cytidylyltransferase [Kofleriaceae bacterium]